MRILAGILLAPVQMLLRHWPAAGSAKLGVDSYFCSLLKTSPAAVVAIFIFTCMGFYWA